MALDVLHLLATAGFVAVASVAASHLFQRTHIPDVLQLILLGVVVGPLLHLLDAGLFSAIAPLAGIAAILLILFDGGLDIQLRDLRSGAGPALLLAAAAWGATAVLGAGVGIAVLDLPASTAILLGMCFGGAGVAIVIPLIRIMRVSREAVALVSLQAAAGDVLVVVGVFSFASSLAVPGSGPASFALGLVLSFAVAVAAGLAAGWGWSHVLGQRWTGGHASIVTVGAVFLVYAATEVLHGSGPLAVLTFALVLGNSSRATALVAAEHPEGLPTAAPRAAGDPSTFHRHAMLAIRSFVFLGLGVTLDVGLLARPAFLGAAALLALAVIVARVWAIGLLGRRRLPSRYDRAAVAAMFPCGLPTAAAALIPASRFGLSGTDLLPPLAALVILLTILANGLVVALLLQPGVRRRINGPAGAW